jgi:P27 family predicted phage terminase small subunit
VSARAPRMPQGLPEAAKKLWRKLAHPLAEAGLLTKTDAPAFRMMCMHYALALEAALVLSTDGLVTVDEKGLTRKHPAHQLMREHSEAFNRYADRFGLTPKARKRFGISDMDEESLVDLLAKEMG